MLHRGLVCEALLSRQFVCRFTNADMFVWLSDSGNHKEVDQWLGIINRQLSLTSTKNAYYTSPLAVDESNRSAISSEFLKIRQHIAPVIDFIEMLFDATQATAVVSAGDIINVGSLLAAINDARPLEERLKRVAQSHIFKSGSHSSDQQLKNIFKRLEGLGYIETSKKGLSYIVTGRMDYLYEVIQFVNEHQRLELEESVSEQQKGMAF